MYPPDAVSWERLLELQVPRKLTRTIRKRWKLGVGFASTGAQVVRPPTQDRQSHAAAAAATLRMAEQHRLGELRPEATVYPVGSGRYQAAAPVLVNRKYTGCLIAGDFALAADEDIDGMSRAEVGFLEALLELAAEEIVSYRSEEADRVRSLNPADTWATRYSYDAIIGRSQAMQELYQILDKVIDSDTTVLIQGENGTGKELVAKAIHYNSSRKSKRFVIQNCSAFNDNLLDSELFGHRKGAFTGAFSDKEGLFDVADGGTFFLDEIGDMSPTLQVKVLRVLQEGTFFPVGDTNSREVDVRIIAATNRDLKKMVEDGSFREDLYYRINVINITMPPLRGRKDDIPLLTDHFLKKHSKKVTKRITAPCMEQLMAYHWPGNVRELENEVERLVVLGGEARELGPALLSPRIQKRTPAVRADVSSPQGLPDALSALERRMIHEVLSRNEWNKTRAATELCISRRNLIRLVQKYELEPRP